MIENMTKKDLEERMVVETREGNRYLVCGNSIIRNKGFCYLSDYNDNLTAKFSSLDIVKVYDVVSTLEDITDPNLTLIWERKHTPEIGDIYMDESNGEKFIIIDITDSSTVFLYFTVNIRDNEIISNIHSKATLSEYKFIENNEGMARDFSLLFEKLKKAH